MTMENESIFPMEELIRTWGVDFPENSTSRELFTFLIRDVDDLREFLEEWKKERENEIYFTLLRLQRKRIGEVKWTKEEFVMEYQKNPIQAISTIYQRKIEPYFLKAMANKGITPEQIYEMWKENQYANPIMYVLEWV